MVSVVQGQSLEPAFERSDSMGIRRCRAVTRRRAVTSNRVCVCAEARGRRRDVPVDANATRLLRASTSPSAPLRDGAERHPACSRSFGTRIRPIPRSRPSSKDRLDESSEARPSDGRCPSSHGCPIRVPRSRRRGPIRESMSRGHSMWRAEHEGIQARQRRSEPVTR